MNDAKAPPRWRFPVFVALAAVIVVGPVYGHFFATGSLEYVGWKMFSRKGSDFCAVDYWQPTGDGGRRALDRYALLGFTGKRPPPGLRLIRDAAAARRVAERMCRAMGRGADVRATLRCASRAGWRPETGGDRNLCPPASRKTKRRRRR